LTKKHKGKRIVNARVKGHCGHKHQGLFVENTFGDTRTTTTQQTKTNHSFVWRKNTDGYSGCCGHGVEQEGVSLKSVLEINNKTTTTTREKKENKPIVFLENNTEGYLGRKEDFGIQKKTTTQQG
jgi:hypothetical protein